MFVFMNPVESDQILSDGAGKSVLWAVSGPMDRAEEEEEKTSLLIFDSDLEKTSTIPNYLAKHL